MSFSYSLELDDNVSLVRFHIADTDPDGYYLDDEVINYLLTTHSSDIGAVVNACILNIIAQLSAPDFTKDWLAVSNAEARRGYENLRRLKRIELGTTTGGITPTSQIELSYRGDSEQDSTDSTFDGGEDVV